MISVGQVPTNCGRPGIRHPRAHEEPAVRIWWTQLHWSGTGAVFCLPFSIHIPHIVCETWFSVMEYVILAGLGFGFLYNKAAKNKQRVGLLNVHWMLSPLKIILYACIMFHKGKKSLSKNIHRSLGCSYYRQCLDKILCIRECNGEICNRVRLRKFLLVLYVRKHSVSWNAEKRSIKQHYIALNQC